MYVLIFEAWARLMGFTQESGQINWNGAILRFTGGNTIGTFRGLSQTNVDIIYLNEFADKGPQNALMLANLMTHISMALIFAFVIMFLVFLFRLVSGMLSGRR